MAIAAVALGLTVMLSVMPLLVVAALGAVLTVGSLVSMAFVSYGIRREERDYFRSRGHPGLGSWGRMSLYARHGFGTVAAQPPGPGRGPRWKATGHATPARPVHGSPPRAADRAGYAILRPRAGRSPSHQAASLPNGPGDADPDPEGDIAGNWPWLAAGLLLSSGALGYVTVVAAGGWQGGSLLPPLAVPLGITGLCLLGQYQANHRAAPTAARMTQGVLVTSMTLLRYETLRRHSHGLAAAAGAGLIALLGIISLFGLEWSLAGFAGRRTISARAAGRPGGRPPEGLRQLSRAADRLVRRLPGRPAPAGRPGGETAPGEAARQRRAATPPAPDRAGAVIAALRPSRRGGPGQRRRTVGGAALAGACATAGVIVASMLMTPGGARPAPAADAATAAPVSRQPPAGQALLSAVFFPPGRYALSGPARRELRFVSHLLAVSPHERVLINGWADDAGSVRSNTRLSRERANAVATYLQRLGADGSQLSLQGSAAVRDVTHGQAVNGRVVILTLLP